MLDLAVHHARQNPIIKLPQMAAVIVRRNVIAIGYNSLKSHPLAARFGRHDEAIYLHAEVDAIKNALRFCRPNELAGCSMYVARVLKNGEPALAKPCKGCVRALATFGIEDVYWTEGSTICKSS